MRKPDTLEGLSMPTARRLEYFLVIYDVKEEEIVTNLRGIYINIYIYINTD